MNIKNRLSGLFGKTTEQKEIDAAVTQMVNAIKNQRSLFKKEIKEWKLAKFAAFNKDMPRRHLLIQLYDDIMDDAFIFGISETRKLRISNKGFVIVNSKGEIDPDKTKLLKKEWFNKLIKVSVESMYYGYSLLYPQELDEDGYIKKLSLVFRDHVVPETEEILKEVFDQSGVKFREAPYDKWMFWINYDNFIGILNKAAPLYIFKKHSWQNWDEFEEMFGIPIRTAKVASTDKRVQQEVDKWLKDLGSAAWGRFPEGVEIDIKESNSRDAFNVFNEKRKACNEELAILFDGNSETSKDTGSRAKAEALIDSTQSLIELDDEMRVQFMVNDDLLPWLINLGYPFEKGDEFQWNYNEQATPKERLDIFKGVKDLGYKVKKEQIETELDVEIVGEYTTAQPVPPNDDDPDKDDPDDIDDKKDDKKPKAGFKLPHAHHKGCGCGACDLTYRLIDFNLLAALSGDEERFLKELWNNPDSINFNYKEFRATHPELLDAVRGGFGNIDFDFQSPDHLTMELFQANIHRFGVDKTLKEILDLNEIIKSAKDFSEFRERAKKLFPNYKELWLRTEWDHAHAVSQMGARQIEMMQDADIAPYWKFKATRDERTTEICNSIHNKVFRKSDSDAWRFLPPLHFKCRSDAEDVLEGYDGNVESFNDAVALDPDGWAKMQKAGFDVNWGDAKEVFTATQGYLRNAGVQPLDVSLFDFSAFGLKPFGSISSKGILPTEHFDFDAFRDRSGLARIEDAEGMPNWLSRELFDSFDDDGKKVIADVLHSADEIYWIDDSGTFTKKYIKYYKGSTYEAVVTYTKNSKATLQQLTKIANPDEQRKGLLIYTPSGQIEWRKGQYSGYSDEYVKHSFDDKNGGYLVSHKLHNKSELSNNLVTGGLLEKLGKAVELLPVVPGKNPDALINGVEWEFKLLTNYSNLFNRIKEEVKRASKQSGNVMLHINGKYNNNDIIRGLNAVIKNDDSRRVRFVALLFNDDKLFVFSRKQIETREFEALLKG
ncbi:phage portal protein family protein [Flavobacterium cerinum]|uniref:DUF935 family protein n=1 Tax=Flavobacterium cerinum TaxID=2502784 RepID=A0A444HES9_9FLAO|nr:DUF935 family protein [Flavobacterium cerinum]RWX03373.1 DUF935 family protein [Flavobacterium cerinum]